MLDKQSEGLGDELIIEIEASAVRLAEQPGLGQVVRFPGISPLFGYRRLLLKRFHYSVVYRVAGQILWIVAIAHTSRKPGYWVGR